MSSFPPITTQQQQKVREEETVKFFSQVVGDVSLPTGYSLEIIPSAQSLALFCSSEPHVVLLERLTNAEWRLLMALCCAYPCYCPYNTLFATMSFLSEQMGSQLITRAQANGTVTMLLEPMRAPLYRLKRKLAPFKIALLSVHHVGYFLAPAAAKMRQNKRRNEKEEYSEK